MSAGVKECPRSVEIQQKIPKKRLEKLQGFSKE